MMKLNRYERSKKSEKFYRSRETFRLQRRHPRSADVVAGSRVLLLRELLLYCSTTTIATASPTQHHCTNTIILKHCHVLTLLFLVLQQQLQ
jgi:hypothetical protein